jgi:transcription initiation factor IIE alpha subunit
MANVDMKILTALEKEMTNGEIVTATGIDRADVGPALTRLRAAGLVISRGRTNKRTHMRMAMAIEKLFDEIDLHELRLTQLERRPAKSK